MIKHDFSKEYKSAKYVKKGNMDGTLSDEIYMIEAVKSSDGCSEFIWKKEGSEYYDALEAAHNDPDDSFTIADAE